MKNVIEKKSIPAIEQLVQDKGLMEDLSKTTTAEEVVSAFAKHEITIPIELATEAFENAHNDEYLNSIEIEDNELCEKDLENVSGGFSVLGGFVVVGSLYLGACAISFILGSAYESQTGQKVRNWFNKTFR